MNNYGQVSININNMGPLLPSIMIASLFAIGDSMVTKYFGSGQIIYLIGSISLIIIGVIGFGYTAHHHGLANSSGLILTLNVLGNILFGVMYFGNSLSLIQYLGVVFGIVAVYILSQS